jgi:hypothetical protein
MEFRGQPIAHLVRHGDYDRGDLKPPLTGLGVDQSLRFGEHINLIHGRGSFLTQIFTSTEERATTTAHWAFKRQTSYVGQHFFTKSEAEIVQCANLRGVFDHEVEKNQSNARAILKSLIDPLAVGDDHTEVLVVTHRRFFANILGDCE